MLPISEVFKALIATAGVVASTSDDIGFSLPPTLDGEVVLSVSLLDELEPPETVSFVMVQMVSLCMVQIVSFFVSVQVTFEPDSIQVLFDEPDSTQDEFDDSTQDEFEDSNQVSFLTMPPFVVMPGGGTLVALSTGGTGGLTPPPPPCGAKASSVPGIIVAAE
jgi:hypothetical protein